MLIDTNIFIDHLRKYQPAIEFFESLVEHDVILFSAITETELLAGQENMLPEKRELLLRFLYRWEKVPIGNPLAERAGDLSRLYSLSVPDAIIAATALQKGAVLLTKNIKDFKRVSALQVRSPY